MENLKTITSLTSGLLGAFKKEQEKITKVYSKEIGYTSNDIEFLFRDLYKFLSNFPEMFEAVQQRWNAQKEFYKKWELNSEYIKAPWGTVLLCTPSNSVIPVIPTLLTGFCSAGNKVVVAPSRKTLNSSEMVLAIIKEVCHNWNFDLFNKGGEMAIKEYVTTNKVNLLYFQGSSRNREKIFSECIKNGVEVIFEGEGNQLTIIDSIPEAINLNKLTRTIQKAKTMCKGQLCTAPNVVFINSNLIKAFVESYLSLDTNLETYKTEELTNEVLESLLNNEVLSSKLRLITYEDFDSVIDLINSIYRFGLQVSFFGNDLETWKEKILKSFHVGRVTLNMNPVYQNSLLPWGGYAKSGYSNVADVLEKATKSVIIES